MLRNLRLVDREDPALEVGADAPMRETYCAIVGATGQPFATADTTRDERLSEHPAREAVQSYCGALLRDARGAPFGTLCHFDVRPCPVPASEIPVLEAVAPLIAAALREEEQDADFRGSAAAG